MKTTAKTGRNQRHHVTAWGETVNGLSRRPSDARWRVIGTDITYTKPDERLAVARFRKLMRSESPAEALLLATRGAGRYGTVLWRHLRNGAFKVKGVDGKATD